MCRAGDREGGKRGLCSESISSSSLPKNVFDMNSHMCPQFEPRLPADMKNVFFYLCDWYKFQIGRCLRQFGRAVWAGYPDNQLGSRA